MSTRVGKLQSPGNSRRQTLGPVPTTAFKNRNNTREDGFVEGGGLPPVKSRAARQSMLPRMGRENGSSNSPTQSSVIHSTTSSSRRKSVGGAALQQQQQQENTKNRLQSSGPPQIAENNSKNRRQSHAPSGRQSLAPQATSSVIVRDPRNFNDKSVQQQSMKKLLSYLIDRGYEHTISMKTLKSPSGKDFGLIMTFLLRRVDGDFQRGETMKFEDEVAATIKGMGYPFPVSKTALVSAGSPHTWPQLLALLSWLLDYLERLEGTPILATPIDDDMNTPNEDETIVYESLQELEEKSDEAFYKFLAGKYDAFLRDDRAGEEEMDNFLVDHCEHGDQYLEREIERLTDCNCHIVEEINQGHDQSEEIRIWSKKREDYAADLEQFQDLVKQNLGNKDGFAAKLEKGKQTLDDINAKIEQTKTRIQELRKTIDEQELSEDDAKKLEIEKRSLAEYLERVMAKRDEMKQTLTTKEAELAEEIAKTETAVAEYNDHISEVSMLPIIGTMYAPLKADFKKDLLDGDQKDFLGVDLKGRVQHQVQSHQPEVDRRTDDKIREHEDALDELQKQENYLKEAVVKKKIFDEENAEAEETLEQERHAHESKLSVRQREADAMKEKVEALRDPVALEEQMAGFERQCAELEALSIRHKEENISRKKAFQKEIASAVSMMQEHDMFVRSTVAGVKDFCDQQRASLRPLSPPSNI